MLSKPAAHTSWSDHRIDRNERLSMRAAIVAGSLATLVLWLGLTEVLVHWM
jgi:hypothetical protein